eukprot:scaffold23767_cov62-Phaeocystis_antarctica.AAC.1
MLSAVTTCWPSRCTSAAVHQRTRQQSPIPPFTSHSLAPYILYPVTLAASTPSPAACAAPAPRTSLSPVCDVGNHTSGPHIRGRPRRIHIDAA